MNLHEIRELVGGDQYHGPDPNRDTFAMIVGLPHPLRELAARKRNSNFRFHLLAFCDYQQERQQGWFEPDLRKYHAYLEKRFAQSARDNHLKSVRAGYKQLLN